MNRTSLCEGGLPPFGPIGPTLPQRGSPSATHEGVPALAGPRAQSLHRFWRDRRGIAITEFALVLPVLMTLLYGAIEITRYILITQKVEKLSHTIADVTGQSDKKVTLVQLGQMMAATSDIMNPYEMGPNGRTFISSVYRKPGDTNASIVWQYPRTGTSDSGGGTLAVGSTIGTKGQVPVLPSGFSVDERENVIVAEVYYQFSPLLTNRWFGTTTIYRSTYYKPRFGALLDEPT
ncbi:MAG: TadE/TadG family type IV pilus assembly protein [Rickettsiales bacterium]